MVREGFGLAPHVREVGRRVVEAGADAGGRSAGRTALHLIAEEIAAIVDIVAVALLGHRDDGADLRGHELVLALEIRDADLGQRRIDVNVTGSRRIHDGSLLLSGWFYRWRISSTGTISPAAPAAASAFARI